MNRTAVYPGTFDPVTKGHEDLVRRAVSIVGEVVVAVAEAGHKHPYFTLAERVDIAQHVFSGMSRVKVVGFSGLLVDFVAEQGAHIVLRGLRAVSDFEYEFQLAGMNRNLNPNIETVFMTPAEQFMFISASMVREVALLGGNIDPFVPPLVAERLRSKILAGKQQSPPGRI